MKHSTPPTHVFALTLPRPHRSTVDPYPTPFRSPPRSGRSPWIATSSACSRTGRAGWRSEEHTSELQSRRDFVCRLLLEKENSRSSLVLPSTLVTASSPLTRV